MADQRNNRVHRKMLDVIDESQDQSRQRRIPVAARVILGLAALVAIGTILLLLPGMAANGRLTFMEAFFTTTSAVTVTGLSVITASTDLTLLGQIVLLLLIQIGGVGYMFAAALAMRILGRRLSLIDRLALTTSLGLDKPEAIFSILKRSFYGIIAIEGLGALLFFIHWTINGIVTPGRALLYATFHAVSAFCNAGFDLFNGLPQYPEGIPNDNISLIIMGLLIFLGGLGIPVLFELFSWPNRDRFSLHTRVTLVVVAALVLLGWLGLFVTEGLQEGVLADASLNRRLVRTWFQSISSRTAGFSGLPNFGEIAPASQLLIMTLMLIGCAPASMGGGITTGTFAVLMLALHTYARGLGRVRVWGRTISLGTVRRAGAVLTISLTLVIVNAWLILSTHSGVALSDAMFEVISALATCGLSLGITGNLNWFGRLVIMVTMFWGRLGAMTIVIAIGQQASKAQRLVKYPEEPILIG